MEEEIEGSKEKKVRVIKKAVMHLTIACKACRSRRTKCDGNSPCSFCESRDLHCEYPEPQKRGPKRKNPEEDPKLKSHQIVNSSKMSLDPAYTECEIIDTSEGAKYCAFYLQFCNFLLPIADHNQMMKPNSIAQKVSVYAATAWASRTIGDEVAAKKYISQARMLSPSIYDSADNNAINAMILLGKYFRLVGDVPRSNHYSTIAYSLSKMTPNKQDITNVLCQVTGIMHHDRLSLPQRAMALKEVAASCCSTLALKTLGEFYKLSASFLDLLKFDILYGITSDFTQPFDAFNDCKLSENEREILLQNVHDMICAGAIAPENDQIAFILNVYGPLFCAVTEWKSGHIPKAIWWTISVMSILQIKLYDSTIGQLAHMPLLVMLGALAKFLHEQGLHDLSRKMCNYISKICSIMTPDLDNVQSIVDQFVSLNLNNALPNLSQVSIPAHLQPAQQIYSQLYTPTLQPNLYNSTITPIIPEPLLHFFQQQTFNVEQFGIQLNQPNLLPQLFNGTTYHYYSGDSGK